MYTIDWCRAYCTDEAFKQDHGDEFKRAGHIANADVAYGHAPDRNDVMPDDDTDDDDEQAIDDEDVVDEGGGGGNLDNDSDDDVVFQAQLPPEPNNQLPQP